MRGLEQEYGERITFVRVNVHNQEAIALQKEYGFTTTPEFFLVDADGTILGHWDEIVDASDIEQTFDRLLAASLTN